MNEKVIAQAMDLLDISEENDVVLDFIFVVLEISLCHWQ
jgi:hypothetical protein